MTLHRPKSPPDCHTNTAAERCGWSWDRGTSCGNVRGPADLARHLDHTPLCRGCARLQRSLDLSAGVAQPLQPDPRGPGAWLDTMTAEAQAMGLYDVPPAPRNGPPVTTK